ncbi:MAG: xylulokinase [Bacillota bacterium]
MGKYLVGISAATVGTTASIYDIEGNKISSSFVESVYQYPQPGYIESKEEDVLHCVFTACKKAIQASGIEPKEIIAVAFSTQANVLCVLDKDERVIRDMIGWQDVRSTSGIDLQTYIDHEELYDLTLTPDASPSNFLRKLLWLRENEPDNYEKTHMFASQQDFLLQRFGVDCHVSDIASISRQSVVDVKKKEYCQSIFEKLDLDINKFPSISASGVPIGKVSKKAARLSGLPEGTLICVGAHNQSCYQIGVGALYPGDNFMLVSTMSTCAVVCENPLHDPRRSLTVKPNPGFDHWSMEGITLCSAGSYRWFRDAFGFAGKGESAYDSINREIELSPPGAHGVTFIPYLQGAFGAKPNPNARGAYVGMTAGTTRGDMARAVMEGITYELYDIIECERAAGVALNKIRLTGFAANFPLWCKTVADILQTPVEITRISDTGTLGAAMLAGVGAGVYKDVYEAADQFVYITSEYLPDPAMAQAYEEGFERYLAIIEGLEFSRVF